MQGKEIIFGLALGALTLSVAPAEAQSDQRRHRPSPPVVIQRPPPLLGPNSLGLIEQGFQVMRGTSHAPDQFLYGRWNPQYQTIRPPVHHQGGGGGGGYYYPPNYGYYPSYPYGYQQYNGFNPYGYQQPVIQREVIIYNNGAAPNAGYGGGAAPVQPQQGTQPAPRPMDGDFYLRDSGRQETLSAALDDIRKAWLNGDFGRFQARVREEGSLRIFVSGEFKYAVEGKAFTGMIKDAMAKIDTLAFEFDRPRADEPGRASVTGRHTFLDGDKQKQTTQISYTLEPVGGRWKIVEAGSAPTAPPAK